MFYFKSDDTLSKLDTSITLSTLCGELTVNIISYNGVDYAIFAGGTINDGSSYSSAMDIINISG